MKAALFQDKLPVQNEIRDAAAQGKFSYPATYGTEGWITGLALEQILKNTGWPATTAGVTAAMEKLNLDTQGMRGGPLVWSAENHFRTKQYYRFYRYDPDRKSVVRTQDWRAVDVVD